jgi:hypothetical protein
MSTDQRPPGTATAALEAAHGSLAGVTRLDELAALFDREGVILHLGGISDDSVAGFVQILEAIRGFTTALPWLSVELGSARPPRANWPSHIWLEVGSYLAPQAPPECTGYGRTFWDSSTRGLWFNPHRGVLLAGTSVAGSPFEGAVHELGHLVMARQGAAGVIDRAVTAVFGEANPGRFVSMYAAHDRGEFWGEVTTATNTMAWLRLPEVSRGLLSRFVAEVNRRADVALI